jgi:hypothetical protein
MVSIHQRAVTNPHLHDVRREPMFAPETHTMSRRERAAYRATIGLAAFLAIASHGGAIERTPDEPDLKQTTGTVTAIEPDSGRVSVTTGCGHALRVIVFRADAACRIEVDGVASPLTSLHRGRIVTVSYRSGPEPCAAERIATIPRPETGGKK